MKIKYFLYFVILFTVFLAGCSNSFNKSSADWAFSFVVYDGYKYRVSDDYIIEINKEIGEVTKYSDMEDTYSGNFSNEYEKGTKYYSIKGISSEEAIAVKEKDGRYRKAIRDGKYGEK